MTQKNDRAALLQNFSEAAGALTTEALNEMNEEKRAILGQVLASGTAHVRLVVILSPLIVIGSLHSTTDRTVKPELLFRIEGDLPSGTTN